MSECKNAIEKIGQDRDKITFGIDGAVIKVDDLKLREEIGEKFVITRGLGGCLFAYSLEAFKKKADAIRAVPMSKGLTMQRFFLSWASEVEADKQGRILVPQNLREFAGLSKEIIVTGVADRAEIWDKARWDEFNCNIDEQDIMEQMEGLDF